MGMLYDLTMISIQEYIFIYQKRQFYHSVMSNDYLSVMSNDQTFVFLFSFLIISIYIWHIIGVNTSEKDHNNTVVSSIISCLNTEKLTICTKMIPAFAL